jgi:hypothetical protein
MSGERDDGGSAFPSISTGVPGQPPQFQQITGGGMTLRDYFAAKAMHALLTSPNRHTVGPNANALSNDSQIARAAYWIADSMLKARGGKI